jgi:MFS superfamily sulfate permease-like transporter
MFALLQLLKYVRSPIPGPVVVVVIAIALSAAFKLETYGIRVVGDIPSGLPALTVPWPTALGWRELILGSAAVWMVSFGAGIVTAKSFGARANFRIDPNAELIGFGAANVAAGLFSGFPVTASDSRTAINMTVGGRTQVASFVAAAALAATLLFLNDALRLLPTPALGAILVSAAISLIDIDSLRSLWRISRFEFAFAVIGIWGVLSLGVLNGVVVAISATLVYLFVKGLYPRDAMLGRIPGRDGFYKLHRTLAARPVPGLELMVIQGSLLFFNVDYVRSRLEEKLAELPEGARWFILDCGAIAQLDSTAADMLAEVHALFASKGITLGLAELNTEPKQVLERAGVLDVFGRKLIFEDLEEALVGFEASSERG